MSSSNKSSGMKSAYELALERLAAAGIEPPREDAFSVEVREQMAEVRRIAESRLAELDILHRDKLKALADPLARAEAEEHLQIDRRRVESERDAKLAKLRAGSS